MLSYIYPLRLRRSAGNVNLYLELLLYQGRVQLATQDALYSDGDHYIPALAATNHLKDFLSKVKNVLVLGVGLGSMVRVMTRKGYRPHFTLVEIDELVLGWAMEFMDKNSASRATPVCTDALLFMKNNTTKYDLIFIDIFNSREVPDFVCTPYFLGLCKSSLTTGGHVAFNYIINDPSQWVQLQEDFETIFPANKIIERDINRILIG